MTRLLDTVPEFYQRFLPDLFRQQVTHEAKATCDNCAMCESSCNNAVGAVDGESRFFRPDTKCCTYHPRLPNYLVGAILSDTSDELAEGRRRLEAKLEARIGITPQWLKPSARYNLLYGNARRAFGRNRALLCPFYEEGSGHCTIWKFRESVCSTYFCKYVEGEDGRRFWMSLKQYLTLLEVQLSRHALMKLFPEFVLSRRDQPDPNATLLGASDMDDGPPPEASYQALWGTWRGREAEFYRRCFELVQSLSKSDVDQMLGQDGEIERAIVESAMTKKHARSLPPVLVFNTAATVKWLPDGSVALGSYSENDAVALPSAAMNLLLEFTGNAPVSSVRETLRQKHQADLDDEVLLELLHHRILMEPNP